MAWRNNAAGKRLTRWKKVFHKIGFFYNDSRVDLKWSFWRKNLLRIEDKKIQKFINLKYWASFFHLFFVLSWHCTVEFLTPVRDLREHRSTSRGFAAGGACSCTRHRSHVCDGKRRGPEGGIRAQTLRMAQNALRASLGRELRIFERSEPRGTKWRYL